KKNDVSESLSFWINEIRWMSDAVTLLQAINEKDIGALKSFITLDRRQDGGQVLTYRLSALRGGVGRARNWVRGRISAGKCGLQRILSDQLGRHRIRPDIRYSRNRDALGLYLIPDDLLSALWAQLATTLGTTTPRRCLRCGDF